MERTKERIEIEGDTRKFLRGCRRFLRRAFHGLFRKPGRWNPRVIVPGGVEQSPRTLQGVNRHGIVGDCESSGIC